jgi:hypothetical protein
MVNWKGPKMKGVCNLGPNARLKCSTNTRSDDHAPSFNSVSVQWDMYQSRPCVSSYRGVKQSNWNVCSLGAAILELYLKSNQFKLNQTRRPLSSGTDCRLCLNTIHPPKRSVWYGSCAKCYLHFYKYELGEFAYSRRVGVWMIISQDVRFRCSKTVSRMRLCPASLTL